MSINTNDWNIIDSKDTILKNMETKIENINKIILDNNTKIDLLLEKINKLETELKTPKRKKSNSENSDSSEYEHMNEHFYDARLTNNIWRTSTSMQNNSHVTLPNLSNHFIKTYKKKNKN